MRIAERVASWSTQLRCCRGQAGARINVNDFIGRESRALADGDAFAGKYKFRYCRTPHLPHCWDAGVLFEETQRTLFCSDLFQQIGDVEPLTSADVAGGSREALTAYQTAFWQSMFPTHRSPGRT